MCKATHWVGCMDSCIGFGVRILVRWLARIPMELGVRISMRLAEVGKNSIELGVRMDSHGVNVRMNSHGVGVRMNSHGVGVRIPLWLVSGFPWGWCQDSPGVW